MSAVHVFGNTAGKEEIACNEPFLLFPQCFLPFWSTFFHFHQIWNCRLSVWERLKYVIWERVKLLYLSSKKWNAFWKMQEMLATSGNAFPRPPMYSKGNLYRGGQILKRWRTRKGRFLYAIKRSETWYMCHRLKLWPCLCLFSVLNEVFVRHHSRTTNSKNLP